MNSTKSLRADTSHERAWAIGIKEFIKGIPGAVGLYSFLKCKSITVGRGGGGFHGDILFQSLVDLIISLLPISSFIETGTYLGESTAYVSRRWRNLTIFTCEINDEFFSRARQRLKTFKNTKLSQTSSPEYIKQLVSSNCIGSLPLFFLDAHWYDYWPLQDEVKLISLSCPTAVVIIDDFEVPGRPEFKYDVGGGGSKEFSGKMVIDQKICSLALIKGALSEKNTYRALQPCYSVRDAFGKRRGELRGHIIIFQNLQEEFQSFKKNPLISKHYTELNAVT